MRLKNNFEFPHPVILKETEYYKDSALDFKLVVEVEDQKAYMNYIFSIKSVFINYLIEEKLAAPYLILTSEYSMYRDIISVDTLNDNAKHIINVENINQKLTISPVILAERDIEKFYSAEFKLDDISYHINKGEVIGYIQPIEFYVENNKSAFKNISSIFTIRLRESSKKKVTYSIDNDLIVVYISNQSSYDNIYDINSSQLFSNILFVTLVLPVLVDALLNLNNPKYIDKQWSNVLIQKVLESRKSYNFTYSQAYDMAQTLLGEPLNNTISELHKVGVQNDNKTK